MWILLIAVIACVIIYKSQERAILKGRKMPLAWLPTLEYPHEEFYVEIMENKKTVTLNAIMFKATETQNNKLVLYYHGNKGNLETVEEYAISFLENGYDILLMDYRGYGKSEGKIDSPEVLLNDALFWFDWIKTNYNYGEIVVVGKSLGSGLATYVASERKCDKLMLITPYDKLVEVGKNKFPWFPVNFFMKYKIPAITWIEKIDCPIRIVHGTNDETIFPERAEKFYEEAVNKGKDVEITWLKAGKHDNLQMYPQYHYWIKKSLRPNIE